MKKGAFFFGLTVEFSYHDFCLVKQNGGLNGKEKSNKEESG